MVVYKNGSTISKIERRIIYAPYALINEFSIALRTSPKDSISNEESSGRLFESELINY